MRSDPQTRVGTHPHPSPHPRATAKPLFCPSNALKLFGGVIVCRRQKERAIGKSQEKSKSAQNLHICKKSSNFAAETKTQESMQKKHNFTSEEARKRESAHWFGQPEGNKLGDPRKAVNQRDFYRWCEREATEQELRDYALDNTKPMARRKFVAALMQCNTVQDFFDLTNQTHGQPKQVIEQTQLPAIEIVLE